MPRASAAMASSTAEIGRSMKTRDFLKADVEIVRSSHPQEMKTHQGWVLPSPG